MRGDRGDWQLVRYDARIVANALRATFARWRDRLLAALLLLLLLAGVHERGGALSSPYDLVAAGVVAALISLLISRLTVARLAWHGADGVLAAQALSTRSRVRYALAAQGAGLALLAPLVLAAKPMPLAVAVPVYALAVLLGFGVPGGGERRAGRIAWMRHLREFARDWRAGCAAAALLLLSLALLAPIADRTTIAAIAGSEALLFGLALTLLDPERVRFLVQAGRGPGALLIAHGAALSAFAPIAALGTVAIDPVAATAVALVSLALFLMLAIRLFSYAVFAKRPAELLIAAVIGVLVLIGYAMPLLVPVAALALLWHLGRRAEARRWLLP